MTRPSVAIERIRGHMLRGSRADVVFANPVRSGRKQPQRIRGGSFRLPPISKLMNILCQPGHSALAAAMIAAIAAPAHANDRDWANGSDAVRAALVAAAVGVPVVRGDGEGAGQAALSIAAAYGAAFGLKQAIPSLRPDGSDRESFPSSHTATAFAAAATLQRRHGWEAGVPAHIAAAFVGVARVEARRHRWRDVIVGAAIGEAAGLLITSRPASGLAIVPWGDTRGGGIVIAARF